MKIRKKIACMLAAVSIIAIAPISAHAEWRQTSNGEWWYAQDNGKGWKIGWASIDNNFYYFYPETGIMAKNITIHTKWGDFSVGSDGAMIKPTEKLYIEVVPPISSVSAFNEDAQGTITGFSGKETELFVPPYINGTKINKIGSCALSSNVNLVNATISDGISELGDYVFQNCPNLKNVTLPDSITTIGEGITMIGDGITKNYSEITFHVKSERVKDLLVKSGVKESNIIIE